jgi:hypothetical protein
MGLLLDYSFSTDPGPLQVSTSSRKTWGRVNVSVTDPTATVYCNHLLIAVPLGDHGTELATALNVPTSAINNASWTVSSAEVGELGGDGLTWAKYTFKAASTVPADWKIDGTNLVPSLLAVINDRPGTFKYVIQETSGTDPSHLTLKSGEFDLDKVLPRFFSQNLVAVAPSSPEVPSTEFALGAPVLLEWESNGTWFELFEKGQPTPVYAGSATTYAVSGGLVTDTTFVLVASLTANPGRDTPSTGYETVSLYDTITLTVSNPALTPTKVTTSGDVGVGGALTVQGAATVVGSATLASLTATSAQVSGRVSAGSVTVAGTVTVVGGLIAPGAAALGSTTVNGTLNVASGAAFGSTTVNGTLVASGAFSAGSVTAGGLTVNGAATVNGLRSNNGISTAGIVGANVLQLNAGDTNAMYITNASGMAQIAGYYNTVVSTGNYVTGVVSMVASKWDTGFATNGYYSTVSGNAMITHLETSSGHRVVTSPLVLDAEVHVSGNARLEAGRAFVQLGRDEVSVVVHGDEHTYLVLVTPTTQCAGLVVAEKSPTGFVVEELGGGSSDAAFDWLLISRKPAGLGATVGAKLPEALPTVAELAPRGE